MQTYTKEQYTKFFDNIEGSNAGWIYKPRTFCSTRLCDLIGIIFSNHDNESSMKQAILEHPRLGSIVVKLMYGDFQDLNDLVEFSKKDSVPDFVEAIKLWRESL